MTGTKVELPRNPVAPGSRWTSAMSVWSLPLQTLSAISQMLTMLTQKSLAGSVSSSRTLDAKLRRIIQHPPHDMGVEQVSHLCSSSPSMAATTSPGVSSKSGAILILPRIRPSGRRPMAPEVPGGRRGRLRAMTTISAPCSTSRRKPASPSRLHRSRRHSTWPPTVDANHVRLPGWQAATFVAAYGVRVAAAPARE